MKKAVESNNIPKAVGPYSQAINFANFVFVSGQIGVDPKTNEIKAGLENQVIQAFKNLSVILEAAGSELNKVLKVNVYLNHMSDFVPMNKIYETKFAKPYPTRATVAVAELPKGALFEIECIAYKNSHHDDHDESGCCGECDC